MQEWWTHRADRTETIEFLQGFIRINSFCSKWDGSALSYTFSDDSPAYVSGVIPIK
jgi:hypothetical protein